MEDQSILETLETSFLDLVDGAVDFAPKILIALLLLAVGSIVSGFVSKIVRKGLGFIENNQFVTATLSDLNLNMVKLSGLISTIVKWVVMLVFWGVAVDVLGLPVLTDTFNSLLAFVPKIFGAAIVAGITYVAAKAVYDIVSDSAHKAGIAPHHTLGSVAKGLVYLFGIPLAAAQLGFDLTIINNNITIIVAGVMLAFGIAFGLGGREVASKIVNDGYMSLKKGSAHKAARRKIQH